MLDFVRLCQEKHIPFLESGHHHTHQGWIQVHCPFCTDGTHGWHLGFSLEHGNMNCWRCGSHSVYEYLKNIFQNRNISIKQLLFVYDNKNNSFIKKQNKTRRKKAKPPKNMTELSHVHKKYLLSRNFDPDKLSDIWNLKGTKNLSGEWNWKIIAPVYNTNNNITAYAGRALAKDFKPKWKISHKDEMSDDPKKMLYGIEKVKDRVLIVEGVSDVWRMGVGAVGVFGIDWNIEQSHILKNFSHRFIMFDPERQAQRKAHELAKWLSAFPGETEIISGLSCDPGDLFQKEADNIMRELGM